MKNNVLYYSVGPLLYCPANRISITDSLINEKFGNRFSLALCLEDTINDDHVEEAEQILILLSARYSYSMNKSHSICPKYLSGFGIHSRFRD